MDDAAALFRRSPMRATTCRGLHAMSNFAGLSATHLARLLKKASAGENLRQVMRGPAMTSPTDLNTHWPRRRPAFQVHAPAFYQD